MKQSEVTAKTLRLANYMRGCCDRRIAGTDTLVDHVPPTPDEIRELVAYLRSKGCNPVIIGSAAIFHHLEVAPHQFRPTSDLDIFVHRKLPPLLPGWKLDTSSPGVTCWISPSGGYVDFMDASHRFPSGEKNPKSVGLEESSPEHYPVAKKFDLLKLKLNSMREKDLFDAIAFCRQTGGVPDAKALGPLNTTQRENLETIRQWVAARPEGGYGQ